MLSKNVFILYLMRIEWEIVFTLLKDIRLSQSSEVIEFYYAFYFLVLFFLNLFYEIENIYYQNYVR